MSEIRADYIEAGKIPFPRWIPVSERLPKHGEEVIVSFCDFTSAAQWDDICQEWYDENGESIKENVTAWMPLPEPYREETEDE